MTMALHEAQRSGDNAVDQGAAPAQPSSSIAANSAELKQLIRDMKNRDATRRARERRLDLLHELTQQMEDIQQVHVDLKISYTTLQRDHVSVLQELQISKHRQTALSSENEALRLELQQLRRMVGGSDGSSYGQMVSPRDAYEQQGDGSPSKRLRQGDSSLGTRVLHVATTTGAMRRMPPPALQVDFAAAPTGSRKRSPEAMHAPSFSALQVSTPQGLCLPVFQADGANMMLTSSAMMAAPFARCLSAEELRVSTELPSVKSRPVMHDGPALECIFRQFAGDQDMKDAFSAALPAVSTPTGHTRSSNQSSSDTNDALARLRGSSPESAGAPQAVNTDRAFTPLLSGTPEPFESSNMLIQLEEMLANDPLLSATLSSMNEQEAADAAAYDELLRGMQWPQKPDLQMGGAMIVTAASGSSTSTAGQHWLQGAPAAPISA